MRPTRGGAPIPSTITITIENAIVVVVSTALAHDLCPWVGGWFSGGGGMGQMDDFLELTSSVILADRISFSEKANFAQTLAALVFSGIAELGRSLCLGSFGSWESGFWARSALDIGDSSATLLDEAAY